MPTRKFSIETEAVIAAEYAAGASSPVLARKYLVHHSTIQDIVHRQGNECRTVQQTNRKYTVNEQYFDVTDTQEKAYMLGFLFADGSNNPPCSYFTIKLHIRDVEMLRRFSQLLESTGPLREYTHVQKSGYCSHMVDMTICSTYMSERLTRLGCVQNKTRKLVFPEWLNTTLYSHFLRGYFDGDGCLSIVPGHEYFGMVGAEVFCQRTAEIIRQGSGANVQVVPCAASIGIRRLYSGGVQQCLKIARWLYRDSRIHLERKYSNFLYLEQMDHARKAARPKQCSICGTTPHYCKGKCSRCYHRLQYHIRRARLSKNNEPDPS